MSDFSDFNIAAIAEAFTVFGSVPVTIDAVPYDAIVNEFSAERELEMGGFMGTYDGVALIQLAAVSGLTAPIERTLEGKTLTVAGRTFRIDKVALDDAGVSLGLANPNKRKK